MDDERYRGEEDAWVDEVRRGLVEKALAANGAAETRNAVRLVHLALELVVVGKFLVCYKR